MHIDLILVPPSSCPLAPSWRIGPLMSDVDANFGVSLVLDLVPDDVYNWNLIEVLVYTVTPQTSKSKFIE